jgi:hypothetical protein
MSILPPSRRHWDLQVIAHRSLSKCAVWGLCRRKSSDPLWVKSKPKPKDMQLCGTVRGSIGGEVNEGEGGDDVVLLYGGGDEWAVCFPR